MATVFNILNGDIDATPLINPLQGLSANMVNNNFIPKLNTIDNAVRTTYKASITIIEANLLNVKREKIVN